MSNNLVQNLVTPSLSEHEVKLYIALIELGETTAKTLSEVTKIKRSTIYSVLGSLHKKGFVSLIDTKRIKRYAAQDPAVIQEFFAEKIRVLNKEMPRLKWLANRLSKKPSIRFFSGIVGARSAYLETLSESNTTIRSIGSVNRVAEVLGRDWVYRYIRSRVRKRIRASSILANDRFSRELASQNRKHLRETILITPKLLPANAEFMIVGHKMTFASFGDEPAGIIIEDKDLAKIMTTLYDLVCRGNRYRP